MSYTTLYMVPEAGSMEPAEEFGNAHGSAAFVWTMLCRARLGLEHWITASAENMKRLWNLANDTSIPDYERIALGTTLDKVMVRKENVPLVVAAFRSFVAAYPPEVHDHTCSLSAQADCLERIAADPRCHAVAWNQTSVCNSWEREGERLDEEEEEDYESRYYDISKDSGHWFLFDELPGFDHLSKRSRA